jgi:hypothetical protein
MISFKKMLRLLVVVFLVHISADALSQKTDSLKCWCKGDKLKWSDFRGKESENKGSYLKAISAIGLLPTSFEKNDLLDYQIKVVFRRYHSWNTDTAKHLLIHEQIHFDIAEFTARKLRKAIQGIKEAIPKPSEKDFDEVFELLYLENVNMQRKYDEDTLHGILANSQIDWEKKVSLELKKLEKYASTSADCK